MKNTSLLQGVSPSAILEAANICDGHTIFKPSAFTDVGIPVDYVSSYVQEIESDTRDPKSTVFRHDGTVINKVEGVYGLRFLTGLCIELEIDTEDSGFNGRGFRAQAMQGAIKKWHDRQPDRDETEPYEGP